MKRDLVILTLIVFFGLGGHVQAQDHGASERGIPFPSEHYAPPEYQQSPQNWNVVQDDRGVIYVANNDGVLEYDGERWRLIPTSTGSFVRSLAVDSLVYVGAKGDFGFLRADTLGVLRYKSLYDEIPSDERNFEDVWGTHVLNDGVYYQTNNRLFRWDGRNITSWSSEAGFHTSFVVDGTLYLRDYERGLLRKKGGSLDAMPRGEIFHETPIYMMASHPDEKLLIGTQNKGLLLYDGESYEPLAPELTAFLKENDLYHGTRLPGNRYALATLGAGVVVVDAEGDVVRVLDESSGLPDTVVNYVYSDREGQLWMALNNAGVFRADVNAPITVHNERTGLEGLVRDISNHRDTTYIATGSGLYLLKAQQDDHGLTEKSARFESWGQLPLVWDLFSFQGDLIVATDENGVYQIHGRTKESIADWQSTFSLTGVDGKNVIYAGTRSGLKGLLREEGEWRSFSFEAVQEELRSVTLSKSSILWISTIQGDIIRLVLSENGRRVVSKSRFDESDGLPEGYTEVTVIDGQIIPFSREGFYRISNPDEPPEAWEFERDPTLLPSPQRVETFSLKAHSTDEVGNRWVALGKKVFFAEASASENYDWREIDPLHFPKSENIRTHGARNGVLWLGDGRKVYRYAPRDRKEVAPPSIEFRPYVRQITTLQKGNVAYGGFGSSLGSDTRLTLSYGRDIRVDVAAPLFSTVKPHQYRYKLLGRSDEWTDWTETASERYRDLWEGSYNLKVQARNDRGELSKVASFKIDILPPWYRSLWAYLFYGVSFVFVAYGYRRYYEVKRDNWRARQRVRKLEQERIVAGRLKRANERLREANRLKEDFLATTSHELRTPLTNILGSIDVLRSMATDEQEQFIDVVEKSGKRLKRTLNALLDLSMLRSGNEDADLSPIPVDESVTDIASDLKERADEKGLSYWVETPDSPVHAAVDEQYLEQILRNLIENGIKFTDEGHVGVRVGRSNGQVWIEVEDTGIGIDEDFLPNLFDEFKQESRGRGRSYEGNGLGLAISARLVEQMDGTIEVETTKGEGSTFRVEFPSSGQRSERDGENEKAQREV